jgi:hypothetical protein
MKKILIALSIIKYFHSCFRKGHKKSYFGDYLKREIFASFLFWLRQFCRCDVLDGFLMYRVWPDNN